MDNRMPALIETYSRIGVLALLFSLAMPAQAEDAEWLVAPYAWLSDVSYEQSIDDGAGGEISGSDLISKADAAGMIRVEAAMNRWGVMVDYLWLGLSDQARVNIPPSATPNASVTAQLDLGIVELGGFYRPSGDDHGVDFLGGVRWVRLDTTLLLIPDVGVTERYDRDTEFTDVFLGARYLHRFDEKWDAALRGDYSFGDTEGTLNLAASVGYRFGRVFALQLGYRHSAYEFDDRITGADETTDIELSGPFLGAVFRFK